MIVVIGSRSIDAHARCAGAVDRPGETLVYIWVSAWFCYLNKFLSYCHLKAAPFQTQIAFICCLIWLFKSFFKRNCSKFTGLPASCLFNCCAGSRMRSPSFRWKINDCACAVNEVGRQGIIFLAFKFCGRYYQQLPILYGAHRVCFLIHFTFTCGRSEGVNGSQYLLVPGG